MSNSTITYIDDADSAIKYTCSNGGVWVEKTGNSSSYAEGTYHYTDNSDCIFTFTFTGVGVAVLGERDTDHGIFSVALDDGERFWVSANAETLKPRWTLASIQGLSNTSHTLLFQSGPLGGFATSIDTIGVASAGGFESLGTPTKDGEWTSSYAYDSYNIPSSFLTNSTAITNSSSPASSSSAASSESDSGSPSSGSSISGGAGVGIGIAAIVGVELLGVLIWMLFKRKRGSSTASRTTKTSFTTFGELPRVNTSDMTHRGPSSASSPGSNGPLNWQHRQNASSLNGVTSLDPPTSFAPRTAPGEL